MSAPKTLAEALAAFQAGPPMLTKNKAGHQSRYADLVQVNEKVLARLNQLGVIYTCAPTMDEGGRFVLEYALRHVASGESLAGRYPLKLSENPQQMGSAITYARRYVLLSLTGVAAEDEDDDGRAAGGRGVAQRATRPAAAKPAGRQVQRATAPPLPSGGPQPYTAAQRAKLMAGFGQIGVDDRAERLDICSRLVGRQLSSANDLTMEEAKRVIDALETAAKQDSPVLWLAELTAAPSDAEPAGEPAPGQAEAA